MKKRQLANEKSTLSFGHAMAQELKEGGILALYGDLGAGKTTLAKGLIHALTGLDIRGITSPTFTYLQLYDNAPLICHFDLYRLHSLEQFIEMGFADYLENKNICLIEWPEKIAPLLPSHTIKLELTYTNEKERELLIS